MKNAAILIFIFIMAFPIKMMRARETVEKKVEEKNDNQKTIVENVTVTNIEVPVRVLYKGNPVTDLSREDFTLYENRKELPINGFFLKKKQIDAPAGSLDRKGKQSRSVQPRTFVLVFSITDFNRHLEKAVNHLFSNVLRTNDRVLIFANDKTIEYANLADRAKIKENLLSDIKKESMKARHRLAIYINKIETYLNMYDFIRETEKMRLNRINQAPQKMIGFLKKYLHTWIDYKMKYLTPRVDRFYFFSRYLEEVKGEKWVLNFYQFDMFPNIRMNSTTMQIISDMATELFNSSEAGAHSMGKLIFSLLNQIMLELNVNRGFPIDAVSKLFYKVDATFHSFFIKSMRKVDYNELEYQEIASDIERTLKEITDITGGESITSNNLVQSIETVSKMEDSYYILTYVPQNPEQVGKLKITVNNKKYKVLYDDNFRADYIDGYLEKLEKQITIPEIKIEDFSFSKNILAFTVKDYLMKVLKGDTDSIGRMVVRIRVTDNENHSLFDQEKCLTARKDHLKISLNAFRRIGRGEYHFLIDATDLLTGKEATSYHNITIKR